MLASASATRNLPRWRLSWWDNRSLVVDPKSGLLEIAVCCYCEDIALVHEVQIEQGRAATMNREYAAVPPQL